MLAAPGGSVPHPLLRGILENADQLQCIFFKPKSNFNLQQECIPVGCVPPAAVDVRGVSPCTPRVDPREQTPPGIMHPLGADTPHPSGTMHTTLPWDHAHHPPGPCTPLGADTPWTMHPPPMDRHTPVNILPCPKLRLRAVISAEKS